MRLRNVKGKKEILDNAIVIIKNPEEYKGSWNKLFLNDRKCIANNLYQINNESKVFDLVNL